MGESFSWGGNIIMLLTLLLTAAATNVNFMADSFHGGTYHFLPPTKEEVNAFVHVHLSICLSVCVSKITQKRVHGFV